MGDEEKGGLVGIDEIKTAVFWKSCFAELIGTFLVVFIGTATSADAIALLSLDFTPITRISFAFGFTVASVMKSINHLTGGHINPAITLGFLISGHVKLIKALLYILSQCLGAIFASVILQEMLPTGSHEDLGLNRVSAEVASVSALVVEIILTFMVVFNVQTFYDKGRPEIKGSGPLGVGIAVVAVHMSGFQWTSCGINPARSVGPALVRLKFEELWIFILGPILGGLLASLFYRFVCKADVSEEA